MRTDFVGGQSELKAGTQSALKVMSPGMKLVAYWPFDGDAGDQIDKVSELALVRTYTPGGTSMDVMVDDGIIGQALEVTSLGGTHNDVDFSTAEAVKQLGVIKGRGFSLFGWFKLGPVALVTGTRFLAYFGGQTNPDTGGFSILEINWQNSAFLTADATDDASVSASQNFNYFDFDLADGTEWNYFHYFYDASAKQMGFSLNNFDPVMFGSDLVFGALSDKMFFQLHLGDLFSSGQTITWDEMGIVVGGRLSKSQNTAIWNDGDGVTWPQIKSIVPPGKQ